MSSLWISKLCGNEKMLYHLCFVISAPLLPATDHMELLCILMFCFGNESWKYFEFLNRNYPNVNLSLLFQKEVMFETKSFEYGLNFSPAMNWVH